MKTKVIEYVLDRRIGNGKWCRLKYGPLKSRKDAKYEQSGWEGETRIVKRTITEELA